MAIDASLSDIPGMSRGIYLKLSGDFDVEAVRNFSEFWRGQIKDGRRFFIVDLSEILGCAQEATQSLREMADTASEKSGGLTLVKPSPAVVAAMRQTGLGGLFAIFLEYRKAFEYLRNLKDRELSAAQRGGVAPDQTTRLPGRSGGTTKVHGTHQPPESTPQSLDQLAANPPQSGRILDHPSAGQSGSDGAVRPLRDSDRPVLRGPGSNTAAGEHAEVGRGIRASGRVDARTARSAGSDPTITPTGRLRGYTNDGRTFRAGRSAGPTTLVAPVIIAVSDSSEHRSLRQAILDIAEEAGVGTSFLLPLPTADRWETLVMAMENASVFIGDVSVDMRTREPTASASMLVAMARCYLPPERVLLLNTGFQAPAIFADHSIYDVSSGRRARSTLAGFMLPFFRRAAAEHPTTAGEEE